MQSDKYIRVKEVAQLLGLGVSTVWLWARQQKLPQPKRLSNRVTVWRLSEIQDFIEKSEVEA
jgi:prophage regulatory protein